MNSTNINLKPLLILLPCFVIIAFLFILDEPLTGQKDNAKKDPGNAIELSMVVGNVGSLQNDPGAPVYELPDDSTEKLGTVQYNCCVLTSDKKAPKGWVSLDLGRYGTGYVSRKSVKLKRIIIQDKDKVRIKMIKESLKYLSLNFKQYGSSLEKGIDCCNFIQRMYEKCGINIPTTCNEIIAEGQQIEKKDVRPGDVVYYAVNGGYGHVGLYMCEDFLINSAGHAGKKYPDGGVRICNIIYRDREEPTFYRIIK